VTALAAADPLTPVRATLAAMGARPDQPPIRGLAPGLTVADPHRWTSARALVSGRLLGDLLDTAQRRWTAAPHVAAALAWKFYSYWVALPAVLGYAAARRIPQVGPSGVLLRWSTREPFLTVGLASAEVVTLASDPVGAGPLPGVRVVADEAALLAELRMALVDEHLTPVLEQIRARVHLGRRTLWGSLASGVAHGLSRAAAVVPGSSLTHAEAVLTALGVADLVDLRPSADGPGLEVHRRTCCLAFALPEPKLCAGCPVLDCRS
jgi:FhuF 2Fe-2S C-terminal domain